MSATKALLEFFGLAAKDASPEELEVLTQNTAIVLDADPAKKAQEAEPTEAPAAEDEAPAKDGADPLAKIMERLTALERVVNKDKEETANDETVIDKALERLKGEDGASEVVEEKTAGAGEKKAVSADAAAAILTAMRPVVAAIEDREVRRSVADALVESVRGSSPVEDIQKAAAASAQKAADEAVKTGYQKICEGQQSAYNARNPHVKKRED